MREPGERGRGDDARRREHEEGLEREAAVLVLLDEALASWCAWGKGGAAAGGGGAVLRQRMADLLIEGRVAKAALHAARAAEGVDEGGGAGPEALRVLQDQVRRCLRLAAQEIGESRGEDRVRWMREELFRRGQAAASSASASAQPEGTTASAATTSASAGAQPEGATASSATANASAIRSAQPEAATNSTTNATASARAPSRPAAPSSSSSSAPGAFDLSLWQRFCAEVVKPAAVEADRRQEVSREIWAALGELGYLQLFHGGASAHQAPLLPAMQALAEACGATFWKATISSALCGKMLAAFAQPALQARWGPPLASGRALGAFAASERGSGSDPASYAARLVRRGGGWILEGEKDRISNAGDADVAAVLAPAFDEAGAPLGLALAVVELAAAGVSRHRHATMGLRAMTFGRLRFAGVALDDAAVTLGTTMPKILTVVEWGQVVQALAGLGAGRAALAEAERFLAERRSFGRPLAGHPALRDQLDGARRRLDAAGALTREAVAEKARGAIAGESIVAAKVAGSEAGLFACQAALRLCGGWGYTAELAVERLVRDAHGNLPAGLPNDRLRELLIAPRLDEDPWATMALLE